jgi:hypothetical protein
MDEVPVDSNKQDNGIWLRYKELSTQERNTDLCAGFYEVEVLSNISTEFTELHCQARCPPTNLFGKSQLKI